MLLKTISPILSIALAVLVFFFFTKPLFAEIGTIQQETTEYREAVEKATEFNNFLQSLIAKRNSFTSEELERLEAFVPQETEEVRALVDLKALADKYRMLFGNVEVIESREDQSSNTEDTGDSNNSIGPNDFETTDISFGIIGTYEEMRMFLEDMERSLTLMELVQLEFQSGEGDLQLYDVTVRLYAHAPDVIQ